MPVISDILLILAGVFIITFTANIYLDCRFIYMLKNRHKDIWLKLDKPGYILRNLSQHRVLQDFLKSGEYIELSDADFTDTAKKLALVGKTHLTVLITFGLLFIIALIT